MGPKPHYRGQLALSLFWNRQKNSHDVSVNHMWKDGAEHVVEERRNSSRSFVVALDVPHFNRITNRCFSAILSRTI